MKPATNGLSGWSYLAETLELAREAPPAMRETSSST
jgi:hypothetical protein